MSEDERIYRNSLSAWNGLIAVGGLQPEGRDEDLANELQRRLDCDAGTLEAALLTAPVESFVQALFRAVQPFPMMFADVLRFFKKAGAHEGQVQWRVGLEGEVAELRHFEEFVEHWRQIRCEFDVPAIDGSQAFLPNDVRTEIGWDYLLKDGSLKPKAEMSGVDDVDAWLAQYDEGRYGRFPASLLPKRLRVGLDDAARIVVAALHVIAQRWSDRNAMLAAYRRPRADLDRRDGLDPWMIAQNETDYWLRTMVLFLGRLSRRPEAEQQRFGTMLAAHYARLGRRRLNADIEVADLERLLSLPAWRKRHAMFGVWVATEMLASLGDHEIVIRHDNGELRFGFGETRIAEIRSTRPALALDAERRTPYATPVGRGRERSVQPDFGLWRDGREAEKCVIVVEVKHYKKRSKRNFRDALIDYARAHARATVLLVNYGPVGAFVDLPSDVAGRCEAMGYLNPQEQAVRDAFRTAVRVRVGDPVKPVAAWLDEGVPAVVVIDVSGSMKETLKSAWFSGFVDDLASRGLEELVLVDTDVRDVAPTRRVHEWLRDNRLGQTYLPGPLSRLLDGSNWALVVTDSDGFASLDRLDVVEIDADVVDGLDAKVAAVRKRST